MTVFFSDIRGFTSITESLPPERMVQLLNRYLSRITDIVMDHQGTLEKYIGDAIMALYNAPLEPPGHLSLAARTALRMLTALELYFAAHFQEALETLRTLLRDYPDDGPTIVLVGRCEGFLDRPPPLDWDGVYVASQK